MKNAKKFLALLLALMMSLSCVALASAEDTFVKNEAEENGTVETANLIQMAQMEGVLSPATDVDCFKFTITKPGLFLLTFDHDYVNSADSYFCVELFKLVTDANNVKKEAKLYSFYSAGNQSDDKDASNALKGVGKVVAPKCSLSVPAAGEFYYIRVSKGTVNDPTVNYKLAYTVDESSFCEKEPNDTPDNANVIVPLFDSLPAKDSEYYTGMLGPKNDVNADLVDYYCINTTSPCYIYFGIKHDTSTTVSKASYKVDVLSYDVGSDGVYSEPTPLGSFSLSRDDSYMISPSIGMGAGSFIFRVTNTTPDYGVYQLFSYYKEVSATKPVESEPNGKREAADVISNTGKIYGSNLDPNDVDWYSVSVTSGEDFTMTFDCIDKSKLTAVARWTVDIYIHGTETIVGTFYPTSEKAATFELPKGTAAKYDIKVTSSVNLANPGDYEISFTHVTHQKDKTFIDRIKDLDFTALLEAFSFITNFNWKEILPSLGAQLVKIVVFIIGIFG